MHAETDAILITPTALEHFKVLVEKEAAPDMGLRLFVDAPGRPNADVGITFCLGTEAQKTDEVLDYDGLTVYLDEASKPYLKAATIDYKTDSLGGELSITAPHLRGEKPAETASLFERVNYMINAEINPHLAAHNGMVTLVEITDDAMAILQFGGGCQGCGMVDVTLKQGIEKNLLAQIPDLKGVKDVTDHTQGENPYFQPESSENAAS